MKSIYESIKGILSEVQQPAWAKTVTNPPLSKTKPTPNPVSKALQKAAPPETKTGTGASGFPVQQPKAPMQQSKVDKPKTMPKFATKKPQATVATSKPAADNAPTSNDAPKPAATGAASLAKAQGKETEAPENDGRAARAMASTSTTSPDISQATKTAPTMQKRASILPADTMQKNLAKARSNLDNMMGNDDDNEDDGRAARAMASKSKTEDEPKPQAAETPAPKADSEKDYSTGRPADKELDTKYSKGNERTDTDGRTYVRQKGVMGQPDTEVRSYASAGDFLNKIRGKGDVNGKVTAKEAYVNKTFGVSNDLTASIMEVMKKKESSAPRNDKEQDLAAHYGDPKRITHGDILVARGVVKQKKVQEGTMRNGKYVDDAPRPGTNEVPSPDEGYRGPGKPLYTPIENKKSSKKAQSTQKESRDTPGNSYEHQCAIHVRSESFGDGRTVTTQHADPDHDGYIAWYDVMFEHGIEKYVPTAELEILVSESHMHSKRKKVVKEEGEQPVLKTADDWEKEKQKKQAASSYAGNQGAQEPAAQEPAAAPATAPKGQAASSYAGARSVDAEPAQAAATPKPSAASGMGAGADKGAPQQAATTSKPAQSDAMSAIDGGSIGTSQSSFQTGPRDAKQGIAANAPAARVVSTSAGAKEAGYTQPNQRIAGFKSNARAREQAAGAAGVEAPMPGGGGKTIAQVRQDLGGKPVSGTPAAAAQNKPQGSAAPAPGAPKINPKSNIAATIERKKQEFMDQAKAAGIPDKAEFTAGQKPGETRSASYSVDTRGGVPQASSTQPAGESPEEKARKAAAAKQLPRSNSFSGQGMVGTDW